MNTGTRIRTVLAVATSLNTALLATDLTGFNNETLDTAYKVVSVFLNFIIVAAATYYNNDYTQTASEYTGLMRMMKKQEEGVIEGEDFTEDLEEEEDEGGEE